MTKPTILIVPGSFTTTTIYAPVVSLLRAQGYPALALELPSTQKRFPLEPATMADDADVIKRAAETLIGQGRELVVVCHSYGGTPTTQGLAGVAGVKRIVYLSAAAPRKGESHITAMELKEGMLPPISVSITPTFLACGFSHRKYLYVTS